MKILVTGATGFIGKHLVKALAEKGHQALAVSHLVLADKKAMAEKAKGVKVVFHLAAIAGVRRGIPRSEYIAANVGVTQKLLQVCRHAKIAKFIFTSSVQALLPTSFYGESKQIAEQCVARSGLDFVIVRPGIVYGDGDKGFVKKLLGLAKLGVFPLVGGGGNKLPIIYVHDLVEILLQSLDKPANTIIWGVGELVSFKKMAQICARSLKKPFITVPLPLFLLKLLAKDQADFLTNNWNIPQTKGTGFAEGLQKSVSWYENNKI